MTLMLDMALASQAAYDRNQVTHISEDGTEGALVIEEANRVIVAFPGTRFDYDDILRDIRATPWYARELSCWCHSGFLKGARKMFPVIIGAVKVGKPVFVAGHSKGGSTGQIFAAMLVKVGVIPEGLWTYGAPRAGFGGLCAITCVIPGKRYVFGEDIVSTVPTILPWKHDRIADRRSTPESGHIFEDHRMQNYVDWATG